MNVILTGPLQVGKSTALARFLQSYPGTVAGFRTAFDTADRTGDRALLLHPVPEDPRSAEPAAPVVWRGGAPAVSTETFDRCVPPLLLQSADLLVMDELGKFERNAGEMRRAVEAAFAGGGHVLAVVRFDAPDWMGALKDRSDVTVLTVSAENRDEIPRRLRELFA